MATTEESIGTETVPDKAAPKTPQLKHRMCPCQIEADPSHSRCGLRLGKGPTTYVSFLIRPMDVCILCTDLRLADTICQYCGIKPSHYYAK